MKALLVSLLALVGTLAVASDAPAQGRGFGNAVVRGVGFGLGQRLAFGGFGGVQAVGFGGYGFRQRAFVQPVYAAPVIQSYSLVQPVQAVTQVQAVYAAPVVQAVVDSCALAVGGCGYGAQAVLGVGSYGFRQPVIQRQVIRQRIIRH